MADLAIKDGSLGKITEEIRVLIDNGFSVFERFGSFEPMMIGGERQLYFSAGGEGQKDVTLRSVEGAVSHYIPIHHEAGDFKSAAITDFEFLPVLRARLAALYK